MLMSDNATKSNMNPTVSGMVQNAIIIWNSVNVPIHILCLLEEMGHFQQHEIFIFIPHSYITIPDISKMSWEEIVETIYKETGNFTGMQYEGVLGKGYIIALSKPEVYCFMSNISALLEDLYYKRIQEFYNE